MPSPHDAGECGDYKNTPTGEPSAIRRPSGLGTREEESREADILARNSFMAAPRSSRSRRAKWAKELQYRLIKELWAFAENRLRFVSSMNGDHIVRCVEAADRPVSLMSVPESRIRRLARITAW